jgi:hypothetical protein
MNLSKKLGCAVATAVVATTLSLSGPVSAHTTGIHDNCTNLNKKWAHGVGRKNAVDKTSGVKVKNFFHSDKAYRAAEGHNSTLDRDNDGIACEKR